MTSTISSSCETSPPSGRPRRSRHEQAADTRKRLLKATVEVLLKKGYSAFRVADAAAAAGISRGAQSHHFPSKDALIEAAIEAVFGEQLEASLTAAAATRSDEILQASVSYTENFLNSDQYFMTMHMLVSAIDNPEIVEKARAISSQNRSRAENVWIDRLVAIGIESDDAADVLWLLWSILRDVALRRRLWNDTDRARRMSTLSLALLDEYVQGLLEHKSRPRRGRKSLSQSSEGRSTVTRKKLLDAAVKIIRERGYARLRSAEISDVAGVSRGGQLHHFPSKDEIVVATFEHIFSEVSEGRNERVIQIRRQVLDYIVEDAAEYFFSYRYRAVLDVLISNGVDDHLANTLRDAAQRQGAVMNETWVAHLAAGGVERAAAQEVVWFLRGVVHGLAIHGFVSRDAEREARVTSLAAKLASTHLQRHCILRTPG